MAKFLARSTVIAGLLILLGVQSAGTAETQNSPRARQQIAVEVIVLKVDLAAKYQYGLDWGKENKMRKGDFAAIAKWLKTQGELTVLCNRRFLAAEGQEMRVHSGLSAPVLIETRMYGSVVRRRRSSGREGESAESVPIDKRGDAGGKRPAEPRSARSYEYKDYANEVRLVLQIQEDKIVMQLQLFMTFMHGRDETKKAPVYGRYEISTSLLAKNAETLILDDLVVNESGGGRTALVVLVTPRIMG